MSKLDELKKIVAAATPGPWVTPEWDDGVWTEPRAEKSGCICKLDCSCVQNPNKDPDAQFIATFNPDLVQRLLRVVETAVCLDDNTTFLVGTTLRAALEELGVVDPAPAPAKRS